MINPARLVRAVFAGIGAFYDTLIPGPNVAGRLDVPVPMCPTCSRVANSECPDAWHALNTSVSSAPEPQTGCRGCSRVGAHRPGCSVDKSSSDPFDETATTIEEFDAMWSASHPVQTQTYGSAICKCGHWLHFGNSCAACGCNDLQFEAPAHAGAVEAVPADTTPGNPTAGTDGPGGGGPPVPSPPGPTNWADLAAPIIERVLRQHRLQGPVMFGQFYCERAEDGSVCDGNYDHADEWDWHMSVVIADALASSHQAAEPTK